MYSVSLLSKKCSSCPNLSEWVYDDIWESIFARFDFDIDQWTTLRLVCRKWNLLLKRSFAGFVRKPAPRCPRVPGMWISTCHTIFTLQSPTHILRFRVYGPPPEIRICFCDECYVPPL